MNPSLTLARDMRSCIVIACGGSGSRMGGGKPLRILAGRPMADRMADWARTQSEHVALALRTLDQVPHLNITSLIDTHSGIGPISALASSFNFAKAEGCDYVLMVGCDQPFLPTDLLARLSAAIGDAAAAMPMYAGRDQPMASLWRADPDSLERFIDEGGQSLWRFAREIGARRIEWDDCGGEDPFFNINDPVALEEAERRLRSAMR